MRNIDKVKSKIQKRLSDNPEPRFLLSTEGKLEILLVTSLLGGPFALLLAFMGRVGRTSLWPIFASIFVFTGWALFVGVNHRSISEEEYFALPPEEQKHRLFYESMWWRLYQGGLALLTSGALIWGAVEIIFHFDYLAMLPLFLGSYFLFLILSFYKHRWIAKVYTEGAKKHRWLKSLVTITFGVIGGVPVLSGIARMVQVTQGREATVDIFMPMFAVGIWILAETLVVLSIIAFLIAHAQYQEWHQR